MVNILLTGSSGNVGEDVFEELFQRRNHFNLRLFLRGSKKNRKLVKTYENQIEIIWGDILDYDSVKRAVKDQDILIHVAGLIPPECYKDNEYTYKVNVIGVRNLLEASKELNTSPRIIYTSSIVVYGDRLNNSMIYNTDEPNPNDIYGLTKLCAEELIKKSGFQYLILRLSYCASIRTLKMNPILFLMPLKTKIEIIHTKDVALAIAKALHNENIWNKTFLLAGGKDCRIQFKTHLNDILEIIGFGRNFLPEEAFEKEAFNCGFCETTEIQKLLSFQQHTLQDFYEEIRNWIGIKRYFVPLVKYFVKKYLLRKLEKSTFLTKANRKKGFEQFKHIIENESNNQVKLTTIKTNQV